MDLSREIITSIVQHALREDVGHGDVTTLAVIPIHSRTEASVVAREAGVVAGLPILAAVFEQVDPTIIISPRVADSDKVEAGTILATLVGHARGILTGERVALNFLQRLSGIATLTATYVAAVDGLAVGILDTRKTTPGLRAFEKYAVRVGGGVNHRFGLYDAIMLKDNHLALLAAEGIDPGEAIRRARAAVGPMVRIEIEVEHVEGARQAAQARADVILLDNMPPAEMRKAVEAVGGRAVIEASGGITLDNLRAVAETGVNYISIGALTHAVRSLDIGLDFV
jgi:nicotinate-nucleotide pyrophosphorylase (carboxylating)